MLVSILEGSFWTWHLWLSRIDEMDLMGKSFKNSRLMVMAK